MNSQNIEQRNEKYEYNSDESLQINSGALLSRSFKKKDWEKLRYRNDVILGKKFVLIKERLYKSSDCTTCTRYFRIQRIMRTL